MSNIRVFFNVEQDADGFPPFSVETLWAIKLDSGFAKIDNIPFYRRGICIDDIVSVYRDGPIYRFENMIQRSMNSTVRVVIFKHYIIPELTENLKAIGCKNEWHKAKKLVAINVDSKEQAVFLNELLDPLFNKGVLDCEEATLRY